MATKNEDLTTTVLIQIRDQLRSMQTDLAGRIDVTNSRLDNLRDFMGDVARDQRARVERLEQRVDRLESSSTR